MSLGQPKIVRYDEETIEYVAWKLAEQDGYKHGRCARIDEYIAKVRDIIVALDEAAEMQDRGEFD